MKPEFTGFLRRPRILGILSIILISAAITAVFRFQRDTPLPPLEPETPWIDVDGARVALHVLETPETARQAFGFDIRGAGLFPVRLSIDNQGSATVRIDAPQTFFVDSRDLAWPLLTTPRAIPRLRAAGSLVPPPAQVSKAWMKAPETLTGFALDILVRGEPDLEQPEGGLFRGWLARFRERPATPLENRVQRHLLGGFPRNPDLEPGRSAEGYLLFPGRPEEIQGLALMRLALALNGRVRVLEITPENLGAAKPAPPDQSRPMAR